MKRGDGGQAARRTLYGTVASFRIGAGAMRVAGPVALAASVMLLAAVGAQIGWRALLPSPAPQLPPVLPDALAPLFAVSPPFGAPIRSAPTDTGAKALPVPALQGDLRLLGVFAARDGRGEALFRSPDRGPVLVNPGDEIGPGVRLVAVLPDRVRIADRGETRELLLRPAATPGRPAAAAAAAPAAAAGRSDRAGCTAPPGFTGNVYRINAELLSGMATQPASWQSMLAGTPGGLTVRDEAGFAAMLGLKVGDRLRDANGIALTGPDDLLGAVVKPLQSNQPVRVRGARGNSEFDFLLVNAAACASRGR